MMEDLLTGEQVQELDFSPITNPNVISLIKQPDGNWRGFTYKYGKIIQVRVGDPQTALVELITHS